MTVVINPTFSFSNEEVKALKLICDMLNALTNEQYDALCCEAAISTELDADLTCLVAFAQAHQD